MAKISSIRKHGAIPDRQHDAFLLALLLALFLNIAFFAVQALIPTIVHLLKLLGPDQSVRHVKEPEPELPFVLVDPSLLDEEPNPDQLTEAMSDKNRVAKQTEERPDLPEEKSYREEGIEELMTMPEGNPGPAMSYLQSSSDLQMPEVAAPVENPDGPEIVEEAAPPQDLPELPEVEDVPEQPVEEPPPPLEDIEPLPEPEPPAAPEPPPEPEQPEPEPVQEPEPQPEPEPEPAHEPPLEPEQQPEPEPPESEPLEAEDPLEEPGPPEIEAETVEPEETTVQEPEPEMIDLAMLPQTSDGFFTPQARQPEETVVRESYIPPPPQDRRERPAEPVPQPMQRQPQQVQQRQIVEPAPERRESRPRRQPTFRKIGPQSEQGGGSAAGGAPPRKSTNTAVKILDASPSMALLTHRYGAYMRKLAEQLQASLLRQIVLNPSAYNRGQVQIRFGIAADGSLSFYETIYPVEGMEAERLMSERMLIEAGDETGKFDPLTPQMQADENFQNMTVIVNLL